MGLPSEPRSLALEARELFVEEFAKRYRSGDDACLGVARTGMARSLLTHEYLVRRGLTIRTGTARIFRLSDLGKDLAFRLQDLNDALGILQEEEAMNEFDPRSVRLQARETFEKHFRQCNRTLNIIPEDAPGRAALEELARKGLAVKNTNGGGGFRIGPRGVEVCMGEADLDQLLGFAPPAEVAEPVAATVNHFHGPIGAVAAAPGASAQGTVNVGYVDAAMHRTIELQDDLGELSDVLLPLLRFARKVDAPTASEAPLAAAVAEANEFKAFQRAVRPNLSRAAVAAAKTVLEAVPLLKPALMLLK